MGVVFGIESITRFLVRGMRNLEELAAALSPVIPRRIPVSICNLTSPTGGSYHGSRPTPTLQYERLSQ